MFDSLFSTELLTIGSLIAAPWILFALFAAFGDACVGFVDEWLLNRLGDTDEDSANAPGKLLLISGFFGFIVALIAFTAVSILPNLTLDFSAHAFDLAVLAGVIEILWLIPYFYALNQGGAVNTTPLFQSIPIFALVFGIFLFDEFPTTLNLVATAFIVIGAFALNYSHELRQVNLKSILLMFSASALIALGLFVFKEAEAGSNFVTAVIGNGLSMSIMSRSIWFVHPIYRQQFNAFIYKFDARVLAGQLSNETLYSVSALAGQMAIVLGPSVMVVSAFNAFHPIFTFIIGWTLSKFNSERYPQIYQ